MALLDLRNRSPEVLMLPDRRLRVTRVYDVINLVPKTPEELLAQVWLPWGEQDEKFTSCRLVKQDVLGQPKDFPEDKKPPYLVRIYEELPATAEQQVGNPGVTVNQYGYKDVTINYLQFSAGTAIYQIPGTTPAPAPFQYCILKEQSFTDDGTLRTIRRTYSEGGLLADNEELKFGGRLKLRTLKSLNVVPHTPDGYTLVTESTEYVNGLPLYSYGYASAAGAIGLGGPISESTQYNMSPDEGTTGVTVKSIIWLTDLTVSDNPIPSPGAGYVLIESSYDDRDGYRAWTAKFAKGQGVIVSDVDTRDGGKLIVYSKTSINAVPSTPAPTIGGTVTLISAKTRNGTDAANGTIVYDYTWAEGFGEVSRETRYSQSSDQGTTGVTAITIRHLSALATVSNPITPPAGTVLISEGFQLQDGYKAWSATYAKGTGEVSRDFTNSQGGPTDFDPANPNLATGSVLCTITHLTASSVTSNPTSAPASGFVLISIDHKESDGYRIWEAKYGFGAGLVLDEVRDLNYGTLVRYRRVSFGSPPSAPAPSIGGTLVATEQLIKNSDGYIIYDYSWAEGDGQSSIETEARPDGSLVYTVTQLSAGTSTYTPPPYPGTGTGYLVEKRTDLVDGFAQNRAIWIKPPADYSFYDTVAWTVPGLATAANPPTFDPPVTRRLRATVSIEFSSSPNSNTAYTVTTYAQLYEVYTRSDDGVTVSTVRALDGYVGLSSVVITGGTYRGIPVTTAVAQVAGSSPSAKPSGLTILDASAEKYLTDVDGNTIWKNTTITFTF